MIVDKTKGDNEMGWAKYYEDNMSIYIGRMAVKNSTPMCGIQSCKMKRLVEDAPIIVKPNYDKVDSPKNQNGRRGLELTFFREPEKKILVKLRMNGWWWSNSNNCWCNLDTIGNRKYARNMISIAGACLTMVNV